MAESIKTYPNYIEKIKINQLFLNRDRKWSIYIKMSKYIDFLINFDIFNQLFDNFYLLIDHFRSYFNLKIEITSKLIDFNWKQIGIILKYWSSTQIRCWNRICVGIWFVLESDSYRNRRRIQTAWNPNHWQFDSGTLIV